MHYLRHREPEHPLVKDLRNDNLWFGKALYGSIIGCLFLGLFHLFLGHTYWLTGDGFVYSDNYEVALEFDATVTHLAVGDGERTQAGEPILTFRSFDLERQLADTGVRLGELQHDLVDTEIELAAVSEHQAAAEEYEHFTATLDEGLTTLASAGHLSLLQSSPERKRRFEAREARIRYHSQASRLADSHKKLEARLASTQSLFDRLMAQYNDGQILAPVDGIATNIQVKPGTVLSKGQSALQLFHGPRYLYCYFDTSSWVSAEVGGKVWVQVPGQRWVTGVIYDLLPVSERVPEEFQPHYKPKQRHQLAKIQLPNGYLDNLALLSTVRVHKPFFL